MEFGDDLILKCPDCRVLFIRHTLLSFHSSGADVWSDGYRSDFFALAEPLAARCPRCGDFFPLDKAEVLFQLPMARGYGEMTVLDPGDDGIPEDYIRALGSPRCAGIERNLRLRLLWRQNDERRGGPGAEKPVLTAGLHDNLERLLEVLGPEDSLLRSEVLRELGDFDEALDTLRDTEGPWAETIRRECKRMNILPVLVDAGTAPRQGFFPFPCNEDVFAFPTAEKEGLKVLLSVDLRLVDTSWEGRGTFFHGEASWLHRCDRLFTEEEWEEFQGFPAHWQDTLRDFWGYRTADIPEDPSRRDRYYRVLYQLYYGIEGPVPEEEIKVQKEWLDPMWEDIAAELAQDGGPQAEWVRKEERRCYWDYFWMVFSGDYPDFSAEDLREAYRRYREYEGNYHRQRRRAVRGLDSVHLGGDPSWFQGLDQTPQTADGKGMEFIGQFWTGDLGLPGSMLVYLFYDPAAGRFVQVYDYD